MGPYRYLLPRAYFPTKLHSTGLYVRIHKEGFEMEMEKWIRPMFATVHQLLLRGVWGPPKGARSWPRVEGMFGAFWAPLGIK